MDDPKALVPGVSLSAPTIDRYAGVVPDVLLSTWREYGLASTASGFVRFVDPGTLVDIVADTTVGYEDAIPLFTTAHIGPLVTG